MFLGYLFGGLIALTPTNPPINGVVVDTVKLKEVVISTKLKRYSSGLSLKIISPVEIEQGRSLLLSEVLFTQAGLNVSSYGPGATSSVSLRGLSSSHTAVLWNGINLQSTMNGGVNFSNIPTFFVDQIAVQQGGNGAIFGSGAIGGVIHLNNILDYGTGHSGEFFQTIGSNGLSYTGAEYSYSGKRIATSSRLFYTEAQNNYKYRNEQGDKREQTNANYRKAGIMETVSYAVTERDKLVVAFWGQDGYNRYPPTMEQSQSLQHDYTSFARISTQWQATRNNVDFNIKSALFNDWQNYRDPYISNSDHKLLLAMLEAEAIFRLSDKHTIEGGLYGNYERVKSTNYADIKDRYRPAATAIYRFRNNSGSVEMFASTRYELVKGETVPLTWSIGSQFGLTQRLKLRVNASRNFRLPSFNDLYWVPGGNPNLRPESGYSQEVNLDYLYTKAGYLISAKGAIFNNLVDNWILWKPQVSGIWSPVNYSKVWSRGAEGSVTFKKRWNKLTVGADLSGSITITTDETKESETKGEQLNYVPRYRSTASLFGDFMGFRIRYSHCYYGRRFYMDDRSKWLNPYSLGNLSIEKTFSATKYKVRAFARLDNIWNESYVIVKGYGMPLLNYQFGVAIQFNKN